jgi:hypothetical protein
MERYDKGKRKKVHTEGVTARQLGLLCVLCLQHVADAVEQLDVALFGVLADGFDKGPGHGACGLGSDGRIGSGCEGRK